LAYQSAGILNKARAILCLAEVGRRERFSFLRPCQRGLSRGFMKINTDDEFEFKPFNRIRSKRSTMFRKLPAI
jgi:hypothetical protein